MKKIVLFILITFLSFMSFGCGTSDGQHSSQPANQETTDSNTIEDSQDSSFKTAVIEQELLYDDHDVKIYSESLEYTDTVVKITYVIENNSNFDYDFSAHAFDINKIMAGGYSIGSDVNVPAGKKGRLQTEAYLSDLEYADSLNVSEINVLFWAYKDYFKEWDTGVLTIHTDIYEDTEKTLTDPDYEDDCVSVMYIESDGSDLIFAVHNKTKYVVGCTFENCSINEWAYDITEYSYDAFDEIINPDAIAIIRLYIDGEFLETNNIDEITDVEFNVLLEDDNWNYEGDMFEYKTGKIKIS